MNDIKDENLNFIIEKTDIKMLKVIEILKENFKSIITSGSNVNLLDNIFVFSYGVKTKINYIAKISSNEKNLLIVEPYDKEMLKDIEKSIVKSDLGLNVNNDGKTIKIIVPKLTEEIRKKMIEKINKIREKYNIVLLLI